jgi:hypothetical protein
LAHPQLEVDHSEISTGENDLNSRGKSYFFRQSVCPPGKKKKAEKNEKNCAPCCHAASFVRGNVHR